MEIRTSLITVGSVLLTGLVISNAFYQKKQFYPSVVHITKSNPSMAVIYLQSLVVVILFGKLVRKLFFGQLRPAEIEHLIERSWYAVTETCLAFTVFRDDFSPKFVALFTVLLFVKCFHWLAEDRVDYMERSPVITLLFHVRMMGLVAVLSATDSYFVSHAYFSTILRGASVQLVFGFEYAILLTSVFMICVKYVLHTVDLRSAHPWENKAVYLLYSELVLDFFRVLLYTIFMVVMMKLHTFPLFSVRPMYLTIRSFKKALSDVIMSRRAISYMDNLYPDVSSEELRSSDNVCIICREEMLSGAKKLPCNHIFHTACLRSWFQRQQTCPTCRLDILQMSAAMRTAPRAQAAADGAPVPNNPATPAQQPVNQANAAQNAVPISGQAPGYPQYWSQNQRPNSASTADSAASASGFPFPPGIQFPTHLPFPVSPPFMLPQMPFLLPFPPPPDFSALSDEEVRRMENVERAGVEARIQCLRNIQTLLDAASVQLQQYLSVLSVLSVTSNQHLVEPNVAYTSSPSKPDESANNGGAVPEDAQDPSTIRQRRVNHFQNRMGEGSSGQANL